MELKTQKLQGGILIVHVQADRINVGNARAFQHALMSVIDEHDQVVLDVQPVRFIDGCGFGALLACLRLINNRCGELVVCGLCASLGSLFVSMRMHRVFHVYTSCDEAVGAFS